MQKEQVRSFCVRFMSFAIDSRFLYGVGFTGGIWGEIIPGGGFIHIVFFSSLIFRNLSKFLYPLNSYSLAFIVQLSECSLNIQFLLCLY